MLSKLNREGAPVVRETSSDYALEPVGRTERAVVFGKPRSFESCNCIVVTECTHTSVQVVHSGGECRFSKVFCSEAIKVLKETKSIDVQLSAPVPEAGVARSTVIGSCGQPDTGQRN